MAWTCSATTQSGLIANLVSTQILQTPRATAALTAADRKFFLPAATPPHAVYADSPAALPAHATISAPHMHAMALELLAEYMPRGAAALDVGAGSGLLCAALAVMAGRDGRVVGIEHAPELATLASDNLARWRAGTDAGVVADAAPIDVSVADARDLAARPTSGPEKQEEGTDTGASRPPWPARFQAIHVGAAAPELPTHLVDRLAAPGALVVPVGPAHGAQELYFVARAADGSLSRRVVCGVRYVPLCSLADQLADER